MGSINDQFSLIKEFKNSVNIQFGVTSVTASSINNNVWVNILLYILEYAPLISGFGAVCYAMTSIISADLLSVLINRNLIIFFNLTIGFCGGIVIAEWLFLKELIIAMIPVAKILSGIV